MLATEAEPAWTAEEIAGTFHVSEENITQLQEDDNGHTLFVLDEYTFVCAPNGARAAPDRSGAHARRQSRIPPIIPKVDTTAKT
mgnify:CR=1 FL=1